MKHTSSIFSICQEITGGRKHFLFRCCCHLCKELTFFFFLEIQHNTVPSLRACLSIGSLNSGENGVGLNLDLYGGHVYHLFLLFKPFLPSSSFLFSPFFSFKWQMLEYNGRRTTSIFFFNLKGDESVLPIMRTG